MFIRWHITNAVDPQHDRMRALLIESKRINGKPRQRHIAFLGAITFGQQDNIEERWWFWQSAHKALDRLDNQITPTQRQEIEQALAKRVRKLTPKQVQGCEQRAAESERQRQENIKKLYESPEFKKLKALGESGYWRRR